MGKKKECPSCAMQVDVKARKCPVCGYEFPTSPKGYIWIAILLVILMLIFIIW
jgi:RNA polymerase subunit RPABC4/transcription elongation factor Spt4